MSATTAQRIVLLADATATAAARTSRGIFSVDRQSVEFGVWLGVGVLGLVWAYLQIALTRRALNRVQQDRGVQQGRSVSSAISELTSSVVAQ